MASVVLRCDGLWFVFALFQGHWARQWIWDRSICHESKKKPVKMTVNYRLAIEHVIYAITHSKRYAHMHLRFCFVLFYGLVVSTDVMPSTWHVFHSQPQHNHFAKITLNSSCIRPQWITNTLNNHLSETYIGIYHYSIEQMASSPQFYAFFYRFICYPCFETASFVCFSVVCLPIRFLLCVNIEI